MGGGLAASICGGSQPNLRPNLAGSLFAPGSVHCYHRIPLHPARIVIEGTYFHMFRRATQYRVLCVAAVLSLVLAGCDSSAPTATPISPTATSEAPASLAAT